MPPPPVPASTTPTRTDTTSTSAEGTARRRAPTTDSSSSTSFVTGSPTGTISGFPITFREVGFNLRQCCTVAVVDIYSIANSNTCYSLLIVFLKLLFQAKSFSAFLRCYCRNATASADQHGSAGQRNHWTEQTGHGCSFQPRPCSWKTQQGCTI